MSAEPPDSPASPDRSEPRRSRLRRPSWLMDTEPLRVPAFRRLWSSTTVTSIGASLTSVAIPKQIFDDTGSSAWVGYSALAGLVPLVVFALWGGAVADAVDRRKLLLVTNTGIALTSLLLFAQAALGLHSVWLLMGLFAVQQALFGMNSPARNAAVARIVPLDQLPAASALSSTVFTFGNVVGPMLAGVLIPITGMSVLYLVDAIALSTAVWAVFRLPPLRPLGEPAAGGKRRAGLKEIGEGFRTMAGEKILLVSFLADVIAMVFGMPKALFPQLAADSFGAEHGLALGVLFAGIPAGAVLGGLFSGKVSRSREHGRLVVGSVCVWGAAMAAFGISGNLWVAALFLMVGGAADMVAMMIRGAILQSVVTDDMRGRMQGAFTVIVAGGPRLADLVHGTAGAAVGARAAVTTGGILNVAAMIATALLVPAFWRYRAPARGGEPVAGSAETAPAEIAPGALRKDPEPAAE